MLSEKDLGQKEGNVKIDKENLTEMESGSQKREALVSYHLTQKLSITDHPPPPKKNPQ